MSATEMTWEQAAAEIARMNAERAAAEDARRAAITPHILRAPKRKPGRMSGPRYFNLMRAMEADAARGGTEYADYRPTTYCGAERTTEDIPRREALAWQRKAPADVAARGVCAECMHLANSNP